MIVFIKYQPNLPTSVSLTAFYKSNHSAKLIKKIIKLYQSFNSTEQLVETSTVFPLCESQCFLAVVGKIVIVGAVAS